MNVKISKIVIMLLSIVVLASGIASCDRFRRGNSKNVDGQSTSMSNTQMLDTQKPPPSAQVETEVESTEVTDVERRAALPKREYGRDDPFERILGSSPKKTSAKPKQVSPPKVTTEKSVPDKEITIGLSMILGNVAILLVDGSTRSISIGDTVAGLKVLEIKASEVILVKGNAKFTVTSETEIKVKTK